MDAISVSPHSNRTWRFPSTSPELEADLSFVAKPTSTQLYNQKLQALKHARASKLTQSHKRLINQNEKPSLADHPIPSSKQVKILVISDSSEEEEEDDNDDDDVASVVSFSSDPNDFIGIYTSIPFSTL